MSRLTTRDVESKVLSKLPQNKTLQNEPKTKPKRWKIDDIPHHDNKILCRELDDASDKDPEFWRKLAEQTGLSSNQIQEMHYNYRKGKFVSLIEEVLAILGDLDKSANQLFVALAKLKQFRAMDVIKKYVDEKYYKIYETEEHLEPNVSMAVPDISDLLRNTNIQGTVDSFELPAVLSDLNAIPSLPFSIPISDSETTGPPSSVAPSMVSSVIDKQEFLHAVPEVDYDELTKATGTWDEKNILGRGGFGTVFRGIWNHTPVAIKRIEPRDKNSKADYKLELKQSMNELRFLNQCRHDNVLCLYGYSIAGAHPCLIYQLMLGGTLEHHLYSTDSLNWQQKFYIALGTARGLQFLHTFRKDKPLIHGDIKPPNILLDQCLTPRIGDFGLTRESPSMKPVEISKVYGTRPYLPPEFIKTKQLSTKIDTYSFGIVLYEMATKKKVSDRNRNPTQLVDLMRNYHDEKVKVTEIIDATHPFDQVASCVFSILVTMGRQCTAIEPSDRPEMQTVYTRIESFSRQQQQQQ